MAAQSQRRSAGSGRAALHDVWTLRKRRRHGGLGRGGSPQQIDDEKEREDGEDDEEEEEAEDEEDDDNEKEGGCRAATADPAGFPPCCSTPKSPNLVFSSFTKSPCFNLYHLVQSKWRDLCLCTCNIKDGRVDGSPAIHVDHHIVAGILFCHQTP